MKSGAIKKCTMVYFVVLQLILITSCESGNDSVGSSNNDEEYFELDEAATPTSTNDEGEFQTDPDLLTDIETPAANLQAEDVVATENQQAQTQSTPGNNETNTEGNEIQTECDASQPWYRDEDGDGCGTNAATEIGCTAPQGFVEVLCDCDDSNSALQEEMIVYYDRDGDGYGAGDPVSLCRERVPSRMSLLYGDCNDNEASIYPGAREILLDDIDQNCNGITSAVATLTATPEVVVAETEQTGLVAQSNRG